MEQAAPHIRHEEDNLKLSTLGMLNPNLLANPYGLTQGTSTAPVVPTMSYVLQPNGTFLPNMVMPSGLQMVLPSSYSVLPQTTTGLVSTSATGMQQPTQSTAADFNLLQNLLSKLAESTAQFTSSAQQSTVSPSSTTASTMNMNTANLWNQTSATPSATLLGTVPQDAYATAAQLNPILASLQQLNSQRITQMNNAATATNYATTSAGPSNSSTPASYP